MKRCILSIWFSTLLTAVLCLCAHAADDVVPGAIHLDKTFVHVGIRWEITGDDDLDANCTLRYRPSGEQNWRNGMDLVRSHLNLSGQGGLRPENRFAGTLFFLESDTVYDIELTLSDPDGGGVQQVVTASTVKPMSDPATPVQYYAVPGDGGGTGSQSDPFKGLQAACDAAQQGAVINVAAGTYDAFTLNVSGDADNPIVLRGPVNPHSESDDSKWAVVDGANTDRGVLTIGTYDRQTAYLIIENLVIQSGVWGIDAQNTHHIAVRHNILRDVGYGYYNRRDKGWEGHQQISDNTLIGRTAWPGSGIPGERGIDLRGSDNIVSYNRVKNFGDGVSVQPFTDAYGYSNDIYGNNISEIVDDPIEIDYNSCNTRVWRNQVINGRMGVSLAPIYGGPVYIFRNVFFNMETSAYKMNREPAGLVIVHNTSAKLNNGTSSSAGWQNTYLRNNIIIGTRYAFEEYALVTGSIDDWDYDALGTTDRSPDLPLAKWDNARYSDLNELRQSSGIEAHAVGITLDDLVSAALPSDYAQGVVADDVDMGLKDGIAAVNAGQVLPNINDPFVSDGQPDCGALEFGKPAPQFGPGAGAFDPGDDPGDSGVPGDDPGGADNPGDGSGGSDPGDSPALPGSSGGGGCFIYCLL